MTATDPDGFEQLAGALRERPRPLALLGAGVSRDAGYPSWDQLLDRMEARAELQHGHKFSAFLRELQDPAWRAEEYRRALGEHEFRTLIAGSFAPREGVGTVLPEVVRLPFRHYLTTNYDSCIERAFEAAASDARGPRRLRVVDWEEPGMREFFRDLSRDVTYPYLVYLHGRYYDPGNIVLTESSYARRYVRSEDARRKLFALFLTQPVVFIGFSLTDPDLNELLREVTARAGGGTPQHFALIGYRVAAQRDVVRRRLQDKYGVQPVFYPVTIAHGAEDHSALVAMLRTLRAEINARELGLPAPNQIDVGPSVPHAVLPAAETDASSAAGEAAPKPPVDPLDHQKGQWGGTADRNGRTLLARVLEIVDGQYCTLDLVVEAAPGAAALADSVGFHLHQTFAPHDHLTVPIEYGRATLRVTAYGAFTVGAEVDAGRTILELDLAQDEQFPEWFRER